jgi:hypothetical protein
VSDFARPVDQVAAALPGTVGEVAERTGFDAGMVLRLITRLRSERVNVVAVEDGVSRSVGRTIDREAPHTATTVYRVDSSSGKE